jgi:phosphatidylserine/phosphatidylglycerophosphate/cardiolipin synthase-like enzyme
MFFFTKVSSQTSLFSEKTFYRQFLKDLEVAQKEVIIECPYLTASRMEMFYPVFQRLLNKRINVNIITRDPSDHDDEYMRDQAANEILRSKELGVNISLLKGKHHRKLSIIDKKILWEGSLNILSQNNSKEIMRRYESPEEVVKMLNFLKLL